MVVVAAVEAKENKVAETTNVVGFVMASTCGRTVGATRMDHATMVERIKGANHNTRSSSSSSSNNSCWHICLLP